MGKNKKGVLAAVILAVLVILAGVAWAIWRPTGTPGDKSISVQVVFEDQSTRDYTIETAEEFLRGALEQENLIQGSESELGLYVTTVDGVVADDSKQQWWRFSKDGESLNTGVDATPIADGDHFEITLVTGW